MAVRTADPGKARAGVAAVEVTLDDLFDDRPKIPVLLLEAALHIPSVRRTQAEEYNKGDCSYQYTGRGGMSWTVPVLAGVLALG